MMGKHTNNVIRTKSAIKKGTTPLKIVANSNRSPTTLRMTNTFIPRGGVIMPISTRESVTTPHQIKS